MRYTLSLDPSLEPMVAWREPYFASISALSAASRAPCAKAARAP